MDGKKEIFKEANISINDNVMKYKNWIVQLSNISMVEIAPIPKDKYPTVAIAGIVLGCVCFTVNIVLALIIIGACAFWQYKVYESNSQLGKYLILELNSGRLLIFSCKDESFLNKVVEIITLCFQGNGKTWFVNFGNCQIGDSNTITNEG